MGFCPHKRGIYDAHLVETAELFQAEREQLSGFGGSNHPAVWRREPAVAIAAEVKIRLSLDAGRNIDSELDTVKAEGTGRLRSVDRSTTVAAKNTEEKLLSASGWALTVATESGKSAKYVYSRGCCLLLLAHRRDGDRCIIKIHRHFVGIFP